MKRFTQFCVFTLTLLTCASAWAQATAQMNGTVRDQSGAVLPGVTVTVTQTDTGFTRTVVTEGSGGYVIPNLPTGPYKLEVSLQGFKTYVQTGIVLQVGATPTLNVALGVGNLEETVAVEAAAPLVDVQSAGISEVVDNERILELPLQGRQVTDLIVLSGAAVNTGQVSGQRNRSDAVAISVAGGLRTGVAYVLDGAMHNDAYDNLNMPFPFPDALQEFRVATSGLSADNGVHSGASVNAVTKSGTNRFSGNVFEFLRDSKFNATDPFAAVGKDGKRVSDGLNRNQYGGTIGGPVLRDKLFFFGAYQATRTRQIPASFLSYVPTTAMLAGDFTDYASAACNAGRALTLRAPFVNNRIDPALMSKAAIAISNKIPSKATNPCGEILFSVPLDNNDAQYVTRVDYQLTSNHSVFGRYIDTLERRLPTLSRTGNPLTVRREFGANKNSRAKSTALGDTLVLGNNMVNSFRVTYNDTSNSLNDPPDKFFDAPEVGVKLYTYVPGTMALAITDGFSISGGNSVKVNVANTAYQVADDVTLVRGRHQIALGTNVSYWKSDSSDFAHTNGTFTFNGTITGRGLADFLSGQASSVEHGAPNSLHMNQWYLGTFAQDAWRATDRVTLNIGLRWEPYFGQAITNGAVSNFVLENFQKGVKTTRFKNAPAGIIYPGDAGFPSGSKGTSTQWGNFSPRAGLAWDVAGDGRTAVRASYGMAYDFPTAQFMYKPATGSPFSNRLLLNAVPFEDPYRNVPGGQTHPLPATPTADAVFPSFAQFLVMDPNNNSTRAQTWNATIERQFGTNWQASASYLGSYLDRLWGGVHQNPGVFMGLGACTLNGVNYPVCTTDANLNQRRVLYQMNPALGAGLAYVNRIADVGTQTYRGLRLSMRRAAANGVSLSGNYTLSHCEADTEVGGSWLQFEEGYIKPDDPSFDRGNCGNDRSHIGNLSVGAQTPRFANTALRVVASDWRVSGILSARSGGWMSITTARDIAGTGIINQRLNQVSDDVYGARTLTSYLNPAAFAYPAAGTYGNSERNSIEGPGFWSIDMALSRLVSMSPTQRVELRLEAFNLMNHMNWGAPTSNYDSRNFGRVTAIAGTPRIIQFGIKYGF